MPDINELIREQRAAFDQQLIATVMSASTDVPHEEEQISREYPLLRPIDIKTTPSASGYIRVERIRVLKRVFPTAPDETYYEARGYGRPLTKKGEVSQREGANWYYLPDDIARKFLGY